MLPYFFRYDRTNYARCGKVYLVDAHQLLPVAVLTEFQRGYFVVKQVPSKFNQVDPVQTQVWLNAIGIVGITKTSTGEEGVTLTGGEGETTAALGTMGCLLQLAVSYICTNKKYVPYRS